MTFHQMGAAQANNKLRIGVRELSANTLRDFVVDLGVEVRNRDQTS